MKKFYSNTILLLIAGILYSCFVLAQVNVVTQHYDLGRTGWYNKETILTKNNVRTGSFGKLFSRTVDDQLYAQPLIVQGVDITGVGKKILYISHQ